MARGLVVAPGVFNAATARLVEDAGFPAAYVSGAGLHARDALSDTGILGRNEMAAACARIARAVRIPLIADADTGFGGPRDVAATVRAFERAGVAAVQIEDQRLPKRCGHLPGKELVSVAEMAAKIRAAVRARRAPGFLVVARTDARGVTGFADAVRRARRYLDVGADVIFPEALATREEFRRFARAVRAPLLANMTEFGRTPYLPARAFEDMGYAIVIFPMTLFRVMMGAADRALRALQAKGSQQGLLPGMQTREAFYRMIRYDATRRS